MRYKATILHTDARTGERRTETDYCSARSAEQAEAHFFREAVLNGRDAEIVCVEPDVRLPRFLLVSVYGQDRTDDGKTIHPDALVEGFLSFAEAAEKLERYCERDSTVPTWTMRKTASDDWYGGAMTGYECFAVNGGGLIVKRKILNAAELGA